MKERATKTVGKSHQNSKQAQSRGLQRTRKSHNHHQHKKKQEAPPKKDGTTHKRKGGIRRWGWRTPERPRAEGDPDQSTSPPPSPTRPDGLPSSLPFCWVDLLSPTPLGGATFILAFGWCCFALPFPNPPGGENQTKTQQRNLI